MAALGTLAKIFDEDAVLPGDRCQARAEAALVVLRDFIQRRDAIYKNDTATLILDVADVMASALDAQVADLAKESQAKRCQAYAAEFKAVDLSRAIFLGAWRDGAREVIRVLRTMRPT